MHPALFLSMVAAVWTLAAFPREVSAELRWRWRRYQNLRRVNRGNPATELRDTVPVGLGRVGRP
jgi:hypothetical protein